MLNFSAFINQLSENFAYDYKASADQFKDLYSDRKLVHSGLVTHAYNSLNDKVATYNHKMGVLSTNRTHSQLEKV